MNNIINELNKKLEHNDMIIKDLLKENTKLSEKNMELENRIEEAIEIEEEIMYLVNKVAITTQNIEVKAVRDRLEDIFKILKGDSNE